MGLFYLLVIIHETLFTKKMKRSEIYQARKKRNGFLKALLSPSNPSHPYKCEAFAILPTKRQALRNIREDGGLVTQHRHGVIHPEIGLVCSHHRGRNKVWFSLPLLEENKDWIFYFTRVYVTSR
jgi:hypothetical protein